MFVELMPMLAGRTVLITVARENDKTVRVCVILPEEGERGRQPRAYNPVELHRHTGRTRRGTGKTLGELR